MAPGIYHMSKLLDQMQGKTRVTTILFYPGSIEGRPGCGSWISRIEMPWATTGSRSTAEGAMMTTIGELLSRDLSRKIEEIIQVDQADEQSVYAEITEYVATDSIRDQYADLFKAIAEAPADPHEGVGVWVSGFFGSGKSSFAKNLGYALQNKQGSRHAFADLFKQPDRGQEARRSARLDHDPVSHRGHPLRGRQGAGHPARSRSGSPS